LPRPGSRPAAAVTRSRQSTTALAAIAHRRSTIPAKAGRVRRRVGRVTVGTDLVRLAIDPQLNVVRERRQATFALLSADLAELAVAGRIELRGNWPTKAPTDRPGRRGSVAGGRYADACR